MRIALLIGIFLITSSAFSADDISVDFTKSASKRIMEDSGVILKITPNPKVVDYILPQRLIFKLPQGISLSVSDTQGLFYQPENSNHLDHLSFAYYKLTPDKALELTTKLNDELGFSSEDLKAWLHYKMWKTTKFFFREKDFGEFTIGYTLRGTFPSSSDELQLDFTVRWNAG